MKKLLLGVAIAATSLSSWATNGYFQHGYGLKAQAMGGAATALALDSYSGANNPAAAAWVGNRLDAELIAFSPKRSAKREGSGPGPFGEAESGSNYFYMPGFGVNHQVNESLAVGVTVYGNGGMNTDYSGSTVPANFCGAGAPESNLLCGQGRLGVNLEQLIIAPTLAYKINEQHSIGISPLLVYQRFEIKGVQAFGNMGMSSDASKLTNNGKDSATGLGVRLGWQGYFTDWLSVGAAYSPQIKMDEFDKYSGLFAQQGRFDLPENYNLGFAVKPLESLTLAVDYQRINYSKVKSVGNSSTIMQPLGSAGGPGFGWSDINVYKIGAAYQLNDLTLRAGFNYGDNPVSSDDITFNILAPGVIKKHATVGFGYNLNEQAEINFTYAHAFRNKVSGNSIIPGLGGAPETVAMHQNIVGLGLGWKF